jgi:hypothetical protein
VLNNVRHKGTLFSGGFFFEKLKSKSKKRLEFFIIYNRLKSRFDPGRSSLALNMILNYRYARRVKDLTRNLTLFLGGKIGFDSHIGYYENWDDSHPYWLTSYFLGLDGILTYKNSPSSSLDVEISIPVLALVSRPPPRFLYKVVNPKFSWLIKEIHHNLKFTSLHRHLVIYLDVVYTFGNTGKTKKRIYWKSCYLKNSLTNSRDLHVLSHTFGISILI